MWVSAAESRRVESERGSFLLVVLDRDESLVLGRDKIRLGVRRAEL